MAYRNSDALEAVLRPVVANGNDYPPSFELATHKHRRGQLLYASTGVVAVSTPQGSWVAPPERAIWIPGSTPHSVRMVGAVSTRSVLIETATAADLGQTCRVVAVSELLRALLVAAADLPLEYDELGRDGMVINLLVAEIARAPTIPLAVPFPSNDRLAKRCHRFLERPQACDTIDLWADQLGIHRRRFTRLFRRETGLSFAAWRQQACLSVAIPRLAAGESVTTIALDLGYESPSTFSTMFKRVLGMPPSRYKS
jgi:AraC-like DNA-binding protein